MPITMLPDVGVLGIKAVPPDTKYAYKYPFGKSLQPNKELHRKLVEHVIARAAASKEYMRPRYPAWRLLDETMTGYIPADEAEAKELEKDWRKPMSMVIPISYAVKETILTYLVNAFLSPPYFRYKGQGPEDAKGAALMELMIDLQMRYFKNALAMYSAWSDATQYGFGAVAVGWKQVHGRQSVVRKRVAFRGFEEAMMGLEPSMVEERESIEKILFEGNEFMEIDPYMCLPDPNAQLRHPDRMQWFGWVDRYNYYDLYSQELNDGEMYNVQYLKHIDSRSQYYDTDESGRNRYSQWRPLHEELKPVDVIWMYDKIIPAELGVGNRTKPEKWLFGVAGDSILIYGKPLDLDHDRFPVAIIAPDYDQRSPTPISRLETVYGMQKATNWFISSHVAAVRKAVNDVLVVDPMRINMDDFRKPGHRYIRLRKSAWGGGVKDAVEQLAITDVTRGHVADASNFVDLINRISASPDNLQGVQRTSSERVTATESGNVFQSALSRLQKIAVIIGLMGHQDLAYMSAKNTQQFAEMERYLELTTGSWTQQLDTIFGEATHAWVSPADLMVEYDLIPHDGSVPATGNANTLLQLLQLAANDPELRTQVSLLNMYLRVGQAAGERNIADFVKRQPQTQVVPNEQAQGMAQQGNLVDMRQFM